AVTAAAMTKGQGPVVAVGGADAGVAGRVGSAEDPHRGEPVAGAGEGAANGFGPPERKGSPLPGEGAGSGEDCPPSGAKGLDIRAPENQCRAQQYPPSRADGPVPCCSSGADGRWRQAHLRGRSWPSRPNFPAQKMIRKMSATTQQKRTRTPSAPMPVPPSTKLR